jgi:hypothetical protein
VGGLRCLHCLLGGPNPTGYPIRLPVGILGRLAGLLGGSGGRRGLVGEVPGDNSQLLGTLVGLLGSLLAAGGQPLGLLQRNVVERCIARLKQHRAIATMYHKLAVSYHSWLVLAALLLWLPQ